MATKIIQLLQAPDDIRIARIDNGKYKPYLPLCIALTETGANQEVVFLEVVDNKVRIIDIEDPDFIGICSVKDNESIVSVEEEYKRRVKSK